MATWRKRCRHPRGRRRVTSAAALDTTADSNGVVCGSVVSSRRRTVRIACSKRTCSEPDLFRVRGCRSDERSREGGLRPGRARHPRPGRDARQARRPDRRGGGGGSAARRLPGDVRLGLPLVHVGPSPPLAGRPAGGGGPRAKAAFAQLARSAVEVPGPAADRLGAIAREHGVWLVTGVNETDPARNGTVYNALLYHTPDGSLALRHRKLVPSNHERLVWGQGDGGGLRALETPLGRIGGLICWENYMPLARFALYESGVEIYIASTADD